ncbi:MAG: site-specific integrase, partial [Oscillospiraceae bacterium]|nr:site-specific integrase [Oscillospiraceae bacterium]
MRMARNIYHRKDGRFEGRYADGFNANGKPKYRSVFGKTYNEVKDKLEKAKSVSINLCSPTAKKSTVIWAVSEYLNELKMRIKPSTLGIYSRYLETYITPYFGNTRCDKLTADILQNFANRLIENGLSVITAQSVFNFLKSALFAEKECIFDVKFPKQVKSATEYLSVNEQKRLEKAAKDRGSTDYIAVMVCLYTGIRIGELCGLMWSDIDFDCKLLRINRTIQRIRSDGENKTEVAFLTPKSTTSAREIPLPDFLLELLRKHLLITDGEYVLNYKNKPIEPRTLQYRFKRILQSADVKDVGF